MRKLSPIFLYLPQLIFGILGPWIIFQYEDAYENMVSFYAATFTVGMLTSGFIFWVQYETQKGIEKDNLGYQVAAYIYLKIILLLIVSIIFGTQIQSLSFAGYKYNYIAIALIILASLPTWTLLYHHGKTLIAIVMAWCEMLCKLSILYVCIILDLELINFLIVSALLNTSISYFELKKVKFRCEDMLRFARGYLPFSVGGVLFSGMWLSLMNGILTSDSKSHLAVFLERTLRILERITAVMSSLIFRFGFTKHGRRRLDPLLNHRNSIAYLFVFISFLAYMQVGELEGVFLLSVFITVYGHLLQQLLKPNSKFNYGTILQCSSVLVVSIMNMDVDTVLLIFMISGSINLLWRSYCVKK
ncbi:MAG: hypothetical protein JJU10_07690 [Idiomarina sp.]|nr:hypothetical protein [Idiomarina sp.]